MTMNPMAEDTECKQALSLQGRRLLSCFLALVLACALVPAQALAPLTAFGAEAEGGDDGGGIDSSGIPYVYGGCIWIYDNVGNLTIRPADEATDTPGYEKGQLPSNLEENPFPWHDDADKRQFVTVKVEEGVVAGTSCKGMFANMGRVTRIDLRGLDTSRVTDMSGMFRFEEFEHEGSLVSSVLETIIFQDLDTKNVTTMAGMFRGCKSLKDIRNFTLNTSNLVHMNSMFEDCESIAEIDLGNCDFSKVQDMRYTFKNCKNLRLVHPFNEATVEKIFNARQVTMMDEMFYGCKELLCLNLSITTKNVTSLKGMFQGCTYLEWIRLDGFDTSDVAGFTGMFAGCRNLKTIFVSSNFVLHSSANTENMFDECKMLMGGFGCSYDMVQANASLTAASIDSMDNPGLFTDGMQESFYDPADIAAPTQGGPGVELAVPLGTEYYVGKPVTPEVVLDRGHYRMVKGQDYVVTYKNNNGVGTGKAIVTGTGQYNGTLEFEFPIVQLLADDITVVFDQPSYAYTGEEVRPQVQVFIGSQQLNPEEFKTIGYRDNTEPGTATIILQVTTPITGTITVERTFQIARKTLAGAQVYVDYASGSYTGSPLQPGVTVLLDGNPLTPGVDYTVGYANNVNPGAATITVTGKGVYEGTVQAGFTITGPLAKAAFRLTSSAFTYDGKAKLPGVAVTLGGKTLRQGTDYTLSYQGNVNAGTAYAVVAGKGIYTGTVRVGFKINPASVTLKAIKFAPLVSKAYNKGNAISQVPTATYGTLTLKNKTDFTVSYKNNKKLGTAKVTVKGKGNYTGTKTLSFKIVRYKQTMTAKAVAKTVKFSSVKKKAASVKKPITVKKAKGKVAYSNVSTSASLKKFKVNAKNGTITVPKGTKKGTYKVKVKVEAKGTSKYAYGTKTVTVKVKVK